MKFTLGHMIVTTAEDCIMLCRIAWKGPDGGKGNEAQDQHGDSIVQFSTISCP